MRRARPSVIPCEMGGVSPPYLLPQDASMTIQACCRVLQQRTIPSWKDVLVVDERSGDPSREDGRPRPSVTNVQWVADEGVRAPVCGPRFLQSAGMNSFNWPEADHFSRSSLLRGGVHRASHRPPRKRACVLAHRRGHSVRRNDGRPRPSLTSVRCNGGETPPVRWDSSSTNVQWVADGGVRAPVCGQ
jgi:hypothetical protein